MNDNIKVSIRIRPQINRERSENAAVLWESLGNIVRLNHHDYPKNDNSTYSFDTIFDPESANDDIFKQVVKPIIDDSFDGYNGTVFAYGQTASGKTHTMTGNETNLGIIPLAVNYIFQYIDMTPGRTYLLRVSFIEIYNEVITDLLDKNQKSLKIFEDVSGMPYIADVTEVVVTSASELLYHLKQGENRRQFGETSMNERSSRSHTIFKIVIESHCTSFSENDEEEAVVVAHVNLVDLAGSEKCGQVNSNQTRFKEGCRINLSLLALSQVISKLSEGNTQFINFRDSKLTRILKPSLGGNSKTAIICNISPCVYDESLSTLKFAERARSIKNKPKINEILCKDSLLKKYENQIQQLKEDLLQEKNFQQCELLQKELHERDSRISELQEKLLSMSKKLIVSSNPFQYPKISKVCSRRETWCAPLGAHRLKLLDDNFQFNNSFNHTETVPLDDSKRNSEYNSNSHTLTFFEESRIDVGVQTERLISTIEENAFSEEIESVTTECDLLKKNYEDVVLLNEQLSRELETLGQKSSEQEAALFNYETQITALIQDNSLLQCNDKSLLDRSCSDDKIRLMDEEQRLTLKIENLENNFQKERESLDQVIVGYRCSEELLQEQNTNYKTQIDEVKGQLSSIETARLKDQENAALTISELKTNVENSLQMNELYQSQLSEVGDHLLEMEKEKRQLNQIINDNQIQLTERTIQLSEIQHEKANLVLQINEMQAELSECANLLLENERVIVQHNGIFGDVQLQLTKFTDNMWEIEEEKEKLNQVVHECEKRLLGFEEFVMVELEAIRKNEKDVTTYKLNKSHEDQISQLREENQMLEVIIGELKSEIITSLDENERLKEDFENEKSLATKLKQQIDENENECIVSLKTKEHENQLNDLKQKINELESTLVLSRDNWESEQEKFEARISEEIKKQDNLCENYNAQIDILLTSQTKLTDENAALKSELSAARGKVNDEIRNKDVLKCKLDEQISQVLDAEIKLKDDLITLQKQIIKEKEEWIDKLAASKAKYDETKDAHETHVFELNEELVECQSNLERCLKDNAVLVQEISKCADTERNMREFYEDKIENVVKMRDEKHGELQSLEVEIGQIKYDFSAQNELLNNKLAEYKNLVQEYENKVSILKENLQCKQTKYDELEKQKEEIEIILQGRIESLNTEVNDLRSLKQGYDDELAKLSAAVESTQSELNLQQETFKTEKDSMKLLHNNRMSELTIDYLKIQEKLDVLLEDNTRLKECRNLQEDEIKRLESVCQELKESYEEQISDLKKTCEDLQEYKETVEGLMETSRVQLFELYDNQTADLEKEQAEHVKTKTKLQNKCAELAKINSELEELKVQLSELITNTQTRENENDLKMAYEGKIVEMAKNYEKQISDLKKTCEDLQEYKETVEGFMESSRVQLFELYDNQTADLEKEQAEHVKTKTKLQNKCAELAKINSELEELKVQLSELITNTQTRENENDLKMAYEGKIVEMAKNYEEQISDLKKTCNDLQEYKETVEGFMESSRVQLFELYDNQTADLEKEQAEHVKTKRELQNKCAELAKINSELEELKLQLSELITNTQTSEIENNLKMAYEGKIAEMTKNYKEIEEKLTKRINFLEDDRNAVESIIEEQRASLFVMVDEKAEELEQEVAKHFKTKTELEELKKILAADIANCSSQSRSLRTPLQQITSLSNKQNDTMKNVNVNEQEDRTELQRMNEKLQKEVASLRGKIQRCDEAKLNQELLIKDCEINELKMHIKKQEAPLKRQIENLKTDCTDYRQRINALKRDVGRMQQLNVTTSDYQKPTKRNETAYDFVDSYKIQELEHENNELKKLLSSFQHGQFKQNAQQL